MLSVNGPLLSKSFSIGPSGSATGRQPVLPRKNARRPSGEVGRDRILFHWRIYCTFLRPTIVADNTLISYFTIEGAFTEEAAHVRQKDPDWAAPLLWRAEFSNVLWLHVRQGEFGLDLAIQHIDLAEELIGDRSYSIAPTEVLRLAVESGCSAYDAHYASLAQQLDVPLVTHDGDVLEGFPETAVHPEDFLKRGQR